MSDSLRNIEPLTLPDVVPAAIASSPPTFTVLDPRRLKVDETYQRNLSDRSLKLISRIVSQWDWARFKPPVVVEVNGEFHVIDGQHTAIAAVTHGGIAEIPVQIVEAPNAQDRARAFVGHNRNRLNVTQHQIYYAELAAGDETAQTIAQVCGRAGVRVLKFPPQYGRFKPGDTMSISALRSLVNAHGAMRARVVLQALTAARCAPVSSDFIKATTEILYGAEFKGSMTAEEITDVVRSWGGVVPDEAKALASARKVQVWRALVMLIAKRGRHGSRSAA